MKICILIESWGNSPWRCSRMLRFLCGLANCRSSLLERPLAFENASTSIMFVLTFTAEVAPAALNSCMTFDVCTNVYDDN